MSDQEKPSTKDALLEYADHFFTRCEEIRAQIDKAVGVAATSAKATYVVAKVASKPIRKKLVKELKGILKLPKSK